MDSRISARNKKNEIQIPALYLSVRTMLTEKIRYQLEECGQFPICHNFVMMTSFSKLLFS